MAFASRAVPSSGYLSTPPALVIIASRAEFPGP